MTSVDIEVTQPHQCLEQVYKENLKSHGVKWHKTSTQLGCALLYLYENLNSAIHIDVLKDHVKDSGIPLTGTDPLQVRHLSTQSGWYIVKEGRYKHKLVSVTEPLPGFIKEKRAIELTPDAWNIIKLEYDNMCVNCGSIEDKPMRWKKTEITKLQQGHMDPRKALTESNCIPQCSFCNQRCKDKAVFDKRGQTIELIKAS